jgi:nicotinamidase-related amidase
MFVLVSSNLLVSLNIERDSSLAATAMHAVENNYRTILIEDACRGVNERQIEVKRLELNANGCIFVNSNVVQMSH